MATQFVSNVYQKPLFTYSKAAKGVLLTNEYNLYCSVADCKTVVFLKPVFQ